MGKWWLAVAVVVMTAGCSPGVDDRPALQTSESTTTTTTTTVEEDPESTQQEKSDSESTRGVRPGQAEAEAYLAVAEALAEDPTAEPSIPLDEVDSSDFLFTGFESRDPEMVFDGDFAYLYATNVFPWGEPINLPTWRTQDFGFWEWVADTLPDLGAWAEEGNTWAPGVFESGDTWVAFYTARVKGTTSDYRYPAGVQCIGRASAAEPYGPFVDPDPEPFICQESLGGSIDPSPFTDTDGSQWLVWKADTNAPHINGTACIYVQQLTDDGQDLTGSASELLCKDQDWEYPLIENPDFYRDDDGVLWMSYSAGWWDSDTYSTGLATCDGPDGPCEKEGQWLATDEELTGPGGVTFVSDGEDDYVVACSWEGGAGFGEGGVGQAAVKKLIHLTAMIKTAKDGVDGGLDVGGIDGKSTDTMPGSGPDSWDFSDPDADRSLWSLPPGDSAGSLDGQCQVTPPVFDDDGDEDQPVRITSVSAARTTAHLDTTGSRETVTTGTVRVPVTTTTTALARTPGTIVTDVGRVPVTTTTTALARTPGTIVADAGRVPVITTTTAAPTFGTLVPSPGLRLG